MDGTIILPGGAGLVGQNLVPLLKAKGYRKLVVLDKHKANCAIMRGLHPDITIEDADLSQSGNWQRHFAGAASVVMLQAQIGGNEYEPFVRNNIDSTRLILDEIKRNAIPYTVHVSSSVVESVADDYYTQTKREQEKLVTESGITCSVLRPTLMFGWFDRKHLGWLARFMRRVSVFPVPGSGNFLRQPLYAGDFSAVIAQAISGRVTGTYNITGLERISYIDLIHQIKRSTHARAAIVRIPYGLFYALLKIWGMFDKDPPFTPQQLKALVAEDIFEVIDWPGIFGVKPTPLADAMDETFNHPQFSHVTLEF